MKLSVQCYTVREALSQDLWGTFAALREIGLNYVEIGGDYGVSPSEMKAGLDKIGLKVSASHANMDELENHFQKVVDDNQIYDNSYVVLSSVNKAKYSQGWEVVAKELEVIGAKLTAEGFKFAYHNHAFEFRLQDGKPGLDILYANSDPKLLEAQLDTYWVAFGNADPAAYIRNLKGRVTHVHLKDGKLGVEEPHFLEIGQGDLNWDDILAACQETGVEFGSIEQDLCARPELESVKISVDFLRSHGISE